MYRLFSLLSAPVILCALTAVAAEDRPRYLAVFTDGTRVEGKKVTGWREHFDEARLDSTSLADENRPLRWFRDLSLQPSTAGATASGFVELIGGDRLPGRVLRYQPRGFGPALGLEPHLVVVPSVVVNRPGRIAPPQIRVRPSYVRRVVWWNRPRRDVEPGTVFYRDGRRASFRSLRWEEDGVAMLLEDGIRRVAFDQIGELHLAAGDPWQLYYDELAILSPDCSERLMRLETIDGLIATSSATWHRGCGGHRDHVDTWYHMVQPAWSMDPLWMRFDRIRTRLYFAPDEVPLSRLAPTQTVRRSALGGGWRWQVDRNVRGGSLKTADGLHGWGFGVHASCELSFPLPECVRALRSRVGLDRVVGQGGCVKAKVYANRSQGNPLYESKHLVGCREVVDTGELPLAGKSGLVLVADAAEGDGPPGSDPLDIRDMLDWIEPTLYLDREKLKAAVRQADGDLVPAWRGWQVRTEDDQQIKITPRWQEDGKPYEHYVVQIAADKRQVALQRQCLVSSSDNWLMVHVRQLNDHVEEPGEFEVRIDGRPIARFKAPAYDRPIPRLVPLTEFQGRRVKLEVVYSPDDTKECLEWLALQPIERYTQVRWSPLVPSETWAVNGTKLTVLSDASILAGGDNRHNDTYVVTARTDLQQITAFRVEALPDDSLPNRGPGRWGDGTFVLSQLTVGRMPATVSTIDGRYVRVELLAENRDPLSLAEVQVLSGDKNVALGGKATQSSTGYDATADRAIDGNTDGTLGAGSVTHTADNAEERWWEVDLGAVHSIDRIVIHNRGDAVEERLSNFRVSVLDAARQPVWEQDIVETPRPSIELRPFSEDAIPLRSVACDYARDETALEEMIRPVDARHGGWANYPEGGKAHVAVFTAEQPAEVQGQTLVFRLKQLFHEPYRTLGRFRLSATGDDPPIAPEPIAKDVPLLTE